MVFVILALVVGWANRATDPSSPLYVEELRLSLVELGRSAGPYQDVIVDTGASDRQVLVEATDESLATLADVQTQIDDAPVDTDLAGPLAVWGEAVFSWQRGATEFREKLLAAADDPEAVGIEVSLTNSLVDLYAGDRLYERFVDRWSEAGADPPVAGFPDFGFLPADYPVGGAAVQLVETARAEESPLRLESDVAIFQVVTEPELVLNTDEQLVVVFTESMVVNVVVVNRGNGISDPIEVTLEMLGPESEPITMTQTVDPLEPDINTTVSFTNLAVTPGSTYELTLTLPLAEGEVESEDNLQAFTFRVNEETSPTTTGG